MLGLMVGFTIGPRALNLIDPADWASTQYVLEQACRITLAIGLMAVGLRVPGSWLAMSWGAALPLILSGMVCMWAATTGAVHLVLGAPLWLAALMAAAITPTDPILARTIVNGELAEELIPRRIRHTLSVESDANDGLAYAAGALAAMMVASGEAQAEADFTELFATIGWEIGMGTVVGVIPWGAEYALEAAPGAPEYH